jgi:hypothetical protein
MSFRAERAFDRVLVLMFENQYPATCWRTPSSAAWRDKGSNWGTTGHAPFADELHCRDRGRAVRRHGGRPGARTLEAALSRW